MTPTVSMRPTVSDRFRETLFVDRFHVSRPIGKRGNGNGRNSSGAGTTVSTFPSRASHGRADAMTKHPASRGDVLAVTPRQSNAIVDDDILTPRERRAFVRCRNSWQIVSAASAVDPRRTRRPPCGSRWECRHCIQAVERKPEAWRAAMPAMRG